MGIKSVTKGIVILTAAILFSSNLSAGPTRYAGGDISLLPTYEDAGAQYKDSEGKPIGDLISFLASTGMNAMRVRLFVDPEGYIAANPGADPNACQSLEYIIPLCRRIVDNGMSLMLDFHYSDTWADPGAQWTPGSWSSLTDEELTARIGQYTRDVLLRLQDEGIVPEFIQPGNEISYGMLWGTPADSDPYKVLPGSDKNWPRFASLLKAAIEECREVCPDARIVIHSERTAYRDILGEFYSKMNSYGVDYDIIGLSYYPYFHCPMNVLSQSLSYLGATFPDKEVMIVETGFPYKWEVPGTTQPVDYDYSLAGQNRFASDLVDMLKSHQNVTGLFWWWLEYNAYGTSLEGWYNAPLFDSTTGRATPALKTIASFASPEEGIRVMVSEENNNAKRFYTPAGLPVENPESLPRGGVYITSDGSKLLK
ncbi:MAG: arabinogalactan endo-1,4-beta-galactosidase [Muribaculaceae bacterium]|nr:arabinogalactan endo-1,4-beta-galactosidase [Muribaculaceae bacterium]